MKKHRFSEACPKLEQSYQFDAATGTLLALAYCREQASLLESARKTYEAVAKLAQDAGEDARFKAAKERAAALEPRISTLSLMVPESLTKLEGFELKLNSLKIDSVAWGKALPLDQGVYTVQGAAPGRQPWSTFVVLRDGGERHVLTVPNLETFPQPSPPPKQHQPHVVGAASSVGNRTQKNPSQGSATGQLRVLSFATGIGSIVSLGIGSFFGLKAVSKHNESNSNDRCDETGCNEQGLALRSEALSAARVSTALFAAGGTLALGSLTLYITSNSQPASRQGRIGVSIARGSNGADLSVSGNF